MAADLDLPLTWDDVCKASLPELIISIRNWLVETDQPCLMHPHGFFVVLLRRSESDEWRFHFWPKGRRLITGMPAFIHTHDRHVESRVLQGRLTNVLYDVVPVAVDGQPLFEVGYAGDRYLANTSNSLNNTYTRVRATVLSSQVVDRGDTYHVERHAYHEAIVSDELATATLVRMHSRSAGPVNVVGLDGFPDVVAFHRVEKRAHDFLAELSL